MVLCLVCNWLNLVCFDEVFNGLRCYSVLYWHSLSACFNYYIKVSNLSFVLRLKRCASWCLLLACFEIVVWRCCLFFSFVCCGASILCFVIWIRCFWCMHVYDCGWWIAFVCLWCCYLTTAYPQTCTERTHLHTTNSNMRRGQSFLNPFLTQYGWIPFILLYKVLSKLQGIFVEKISSNPNLKLIFTWKTSIYCIYCI